MMRAISKQCGKRQHDNDLLIIQDRIGETKLGRYFRTFTGYLLIFPDLFLRDKIITSERSECSSYYQSYMRHLDDMQTAALKPLKRIGKKWNIFL